jgi:hypothetical protein
VNEFYELSDEDINAGFEYILKNAPRSTAELKQLVWQTKALRKGAPLYGWPVPLVAKALSGLAAEGALAKKEFENNVILCEDHFNLRVLEAMQELINSNDSLVLIGEPNIGKTPLGRAFLMAMCRRNARVHGLDPAGCCIRVTPEIDFLRGEPGDILMGDFVDDGCLNLLPPKMVKALLDVGQYESMCWARWGATKWKKGEPRCLADQTYDPNAEKLDRWPSVKFQEFFELVRPAFSEKATRACMLAFFKRSAFLVNTQEYLYWRPAGTEEKDVPRINFKGETFLTAEGKRLYLLQKDGDMTPPDNLKAEGKPRTVAPAGYRSRRKPRNRGRICETEPMVIALRGPVIDLRGVELMPRAGADRDRRTQQDVNGFEEVCPRTEISSLQCQSLRHVLGGKAQSLLDVGVHIGADLFREQLLPFAVLAEKPDSAQDRENPICVGAIRRTLIERTKTRAQPIDPVAQGAAHNVFCGGEPEILAIGKLERGEVNQRQLRRQGTRRRRPRIVQIRARQHRKQ